MPSLQSGSALPEPEPEAIAEPPTWRGEGRDLSLPFLGLPLPFLDFPLPLLDLSLPFMDLTLPPFLDLPLPFIASSPEPLAPSHCAKAPLITCSSLHARHLADGVVAKCFARPKRWHAGRADGVAASLWYLTDGVGEVLMVLLAGRPERRPVAVDRRLPHRHLPAHPRRCECGGSPLLIPIETPAEVRRGCSRTTAPASGWYQFC